MISIAQIAQAMQTVLIEHAAQAAQTHQVVRRKRQLDGAQLVQLVVGSFWSDPDASYETMTDLAADWDITISPQGLALRFAQNAVACFADVLAAAMRQVITADPAVLPLLDRFPAVEIHDTTTMTLPDTLANHFAGCGGSSGRIAAAVKAHLRWEVRSGRLDGPILQPGRASDRAVEFVQRAAPGTVRIRDLGFWHLDDMQQDDRDGRFWVTRLKPRTAIFTAAGERHELAELLDNATSDVVDLPVQLGVKQRLPSRLIARRVDPDLAEARLRSLEHTARRKGRTVSTSARLTATWDVVVTNVPGERLSAAEALILYRIRWQIELLFKLWKQHGKLDVSRGQQPARVLIELYAKFIGLLLQHWLLLVSCWTMADRSLVKAARVVRGRVKRIMGALTQPAELERVLTDIVAAIQRTRPQTRRKKTPGTWALLGGQPTTLT
jgi:hypothetical protein